jgi:hypothetical protein
VSRRRHIAALVALTVAMALASAGVAQAKPIETVSLALTSAGAPQIFQSGHARGWNLAVADFIDQATGATAFAPVLRGRPAHPVITVSLLSSGDPPISFWVSPCSAWTLGAVVFVDARDQDQVGAGSFFDVIEPVTRPPVVPIFSIPARPRP